MSVAVGIMARAPSSGGKTRLAPHFDPPRLAALRSALLADTLDTLAPVANVTIFFTPDECLAEMTAIAGHRPLVSQGDGDLGARMLRAFQRLLQVPAPEAAILVGTDIPLLTSEHIQEAGGILRADGGIVLGPADDGGYYLIGMTRARPELFDGIAWGGAGVLADTVRAARRAGVDARLVPGLYDVDTIDDLRRLERDLAAAPSHIAAHVRRWL